ncbi:hypothetical protein C3B44_02900 [Corynebacterium yudongzhengii]|uniref:Beta-N-acetylglucosaminidase n=1 Tax=Corynebacterium yudongzhengii TaxID=2080740 RepID=A0A2U1T4Z6_9CORY|nr:hypothetical protein [Corynebacterium yudongzhengii]AWB81433.1 hypothetical protein C3B44_02900 [Corynebacterium yudongzhengii]PWC01069.1 hypothetical protein DF222_09265 [Corynebacterium yudongzhengii]
MVSSPAPLKRRLVTGFVATVASVALVACSGDAEPADTQPTQPRSAEETTTRHQESETTTESSETAEASEAADSETSTPADDELGEGVDTAREIFAPLLPAELWKEFDSCSSTGIEDSYECTGDEVGQFQLFESSSKAASTTQLLTELRSSRIVRDTGRFVVGWSTLGTTAVITIVDNDNGLVAQQMVSSDQVEPEERIEELGLAHPDGLSDEEAAEPTELSTPQAPEDEEA